MSLWERGGEGEFHVKVGLSQRSEVEERALFGVLLARLSRVFQAQPRISAAECLLSGIEKPLGLD
jgi:hypothetical protein